VVGKVKGKPNKKLKQNGCMKKPAWKDASKCKAPNELNER
tara:strand:- start:82 stop:201 length:120 start_codon:yes stop_codon:yes gene_type:complete